MGNSLLAMELIENIPRELLNDNGGHGYTALIMACFVDFRQVAEALM
jgi:hypothetical protein